MKRHRVRAAGLVVSVVALIALLAPASVGASAVTQWNANATSFLTGPAVWQAPPVSMVHLAMVHGAVFDAVNAIDGGYTPYLAMPDATPFDSQDAAAVTAACLVLTNILGDPALAATTAPAQLPALATLCKNAIDAIPDSLAKTGGINAGVAAANAMIAARTGDGRFGPFRFATGTAPGVWRPPLPPFTIDPNSWIKDVEPFLIRSSSQFRTRGPWALKSPHYTREFNEVKSVGSATSTTRTQHQTDAARYWAVHPPATWSRIVRGLDAQAGLSTADAARLYAQIYLTGADSLISIWDDKAYWNFWRPITAIREAATDGNPATEADPNWLPLIANPPYPEHPSGHLGVSGAFVETLQEFFRTDEIGWSDTIGTFTPPITMTYTSLSEALNEIVEVRIWSGIHFRAADEQSADLAKKVADWRKAHYFKKRH
jgi:hypothetical protein